MVSNLNTISPPRCSAPQRAKSAVKFAQIKFWSRSNRNWTIKAPPTKGCWEILFLSFATFVSYISSSHIVYISEKFTPRDTYCSDNEHLKMQQVHKCNNYDQKGLRVPIQKGTAVCFWENWMINAFPEKRTWLPPLSVLPITGSFIHWCCYRAQPSMVEEKYLVQLNVEWTIENLNSAAWCWRWKVRMWARVSDKMSSFSWKALVIFE